MIYCLESRPFWDGETSCYWDSDSTKFEFSSHNLTQLFRLFYAKFGSPIGSVYGQTLIDFYFLETGPEIYDQFFSENHPENIFRIRSCNSEITKNRLITDPFEISQET